MSSCAALAWRVDVPSASPSTHAWMAPPVSPRRIASRARTRSAVGPSATPPVRATWSSWAMTFGSSPRASASWACWMVRSCCRWRRRLHPKLAMSAPKTTSPRRSGVAAGTHAAAPWRGSSVDGSRRDQIATNAPIATTASAAVLAPSVRRRLRGRAGAPVIVAAAGGALCAAGATSSASGPCAVAGTNRAASGAIFRTQSRASSSPGSSSTAASRYTLRAVGCPMRRSARDSMRSRGPSSSASASPSAA